MMVFIAYAVLIFWAVGKHRRRWWGIFYVFLGVAGILVTSLVHWKLSEWTSGQVSLPLLQAMLYPFAALVLATSLYIFLLPRRAQPHLCRRCSYDLTGQEESPAICPECGLIHGAGMRPSGLCGACGRERMRCSCKVKPEATVESASDMAARRRRAAQSLLEREQGVSGG